MSVSYMVFYRGKAQNQDTFLQYYRENHVPILKRFPGIQQVILHSPLPVEDTESVVPGEFSLVAEMQFDTEANLATALKSQARQEARVDFGKFPSFTGEVWHQAMFTEEP